MCQSIIRQKTFISVLISKYGDNMWDNTNKIETAYIKKDINSCRLMLPSESGFFGFRRFFKTFNLMMVINLSLKVLEMAYEYIKNYLHKLNQPDLGDSYIWRMPNKLTVMNYE